MCGIAGLMTADGAPPDARVLDRLADALAHRGPDGRGRFVADGIGLVHDRLSIIDLATGTQPLDDGAGRVLVANAEIYNYVELRRELGEHTFRTGSDCEVPLRLYATMGLDFVDRLRGMYAIALYDHPRRRLVLARDPFGIKPLYVASNSAGLAFASEAQALIAAGIVAPSVRIQARDELLALQFTTGRETIFAGIERVLPGDLLVIEQGRIIERRRRAALPSDGPTEWRERDALDRLDAVLRDSVALHQRSDVPFGLFLSGGIDSATVLTMMAALNERPVRAYTIGFPGAGVHDERAQARRLAHALRAEHVDVPFEARDFWRLLPRVAAALDDPAADYATVPTFMLAERARSEVKVVLSGEGGDELFAGYGRYRARLRPWWLGGPKAMRARHPFEGLDLLRAPLIEHRVFEGNTPSPAWDPLQRAQAEDCTDWLPNDLLAKLDRCLMAHGIEGRTPFLDPEVAAFAFRLPQALKVRRRLGKWLLRRWLAEKSHALEPFARKRGFTVPVGEWIAAEASRLGPLLDREPLIQELCRPGAITRACHDARGRSGQAVWRLLFFVLWHRRHVLGRPPEGDVFETLSSRV